jgi:hypothetical protein
MIFKCTIPTTIQYHNSQLPGNHHPATYFDGERNKAFKTIDCLVNILSSNQTSVPRMAPSSELYDALHPSSSRRFSKHKKTIILLLLIFALCALYQNSYQVSSIANMNRELERKTISEAAQPFSKPMEGQRLRAKPTQEQMANHYNSTTSVDNIPSDAVGEKIQMNNMPVDNKEGSEQMHDSNSTVPLQNETSSNRANAETPEAAESALSLSHSSIEEETSTATSCPFNWTKSWLQNTRYGNIPETNSHTLPIEGPLLSHSNLQALLDQQRICEGDCPFRKVSDVSNLKAEDISEEEIYIWTVRLIYVSIYYHQHRHAIREGVERKKSLSKDNVDLSSACSTEMEEFKVGTFDYECKDAKYLVTQTPEGGMGFMYLFRMLNMVMSA